jgi:enamine deaminase RidA (YjgF/YER057c/UK114 family)
MDSEGNVMHKYDLAAQTRIAMENIAKVLAEFGASMQDVVKINRWYVAGGTREEWVNVARIMASFFTEPGPAATGIPADPRLRRSHG